MLRAGMGVLLLPLWLPAQQNKLAVAPIDPVSVKAGGKVTQNLKLVVIPGFHVNSDKPKDEFIIPLKVSWLPGPLEAKSIAYPKAEEMKVWTQDLTVFTGTFVVRTEFEAPAGAKHGGAVMQGKVRYQACNNEMCFRPSTVDVHVPVVIE